MSKKQNLVIFCDCGLEKTKKQCKLSSDHHGNDVLKKVC